MRFSLLIPTRGRHKKLENFTESILKETANKSNIELLYITDNDDTMTHAKIRHLRERYGSLMEMHLLMRERSEFLNRDYYNWAAAQAKNEMIWVLADDLMFCRQNWDITVANAVNKFFETHPDRVVCVSIKDNTPVPRNDMPKFPCYPMFSKEAIKAQGFMLHPQIPTWGADYIAYKIFQPIGRLLEIHDINYINHISYHTHQEVPDETNIRIGAIFNKLKMIPEYNTDRIMKEECPIIGQQILKYIEDLKLGVKV